jgi:serine/threonine-protein kinase RsbW
MSISVPHATSKSFRRTVESLEEIFEFVRLFIHSNAIDPSNTYAIEFAIEELFTNMVKYNPDGSGDIVVSMRREPHRAVISMVDREDKPFDITKTADVDTQKRIDERKPGGLGIHLLKRVMDEVHYEHRNKTSTTTLIKYLEN